MIADYVNSQREEAKEEPVRKAAGKGSIFNFQNKG